MIEGNETCDGAALNGQSCVSQGFSGGTLACNGSCNGYNTGGCVNNSGNCCYVDGGAGCQYPAIQNCVCNLDSWCCLIEWDNVCVNLAINSCGAVCQ